MDEKQNGYALRNQMKKFHSSDFIYIWFKTGKNNIFATDVRIAFIWGSVITGRTWQKFLQCWYYSMFNSVVVIHIDAYVKTLLAISSRWVHSTCVTVLQYKSKKN